MFFDSCLLTTLGLVSRKPAASDRRGSLLCHSHRCEHIASSTSPAAIARAFLWRLLSSILLATRCGRPVARVVLLLHLLPLARCFVAGCSGRLLRLPLPWPALPLARQNESSIWELSIGGHKLGGRIGACGGRARLARARRAARVAAPGAGLEQGRSGNAGAPCRKMVEPHIISLLRRAKLLASHGQPRRRRTIEQPTTLQRTRRENRMNEHVFRFVFCSPLWA
jgi:hypothetical protein